MPDPVSALALTGHRHYRGYQDPATLPLYRHLVVSGAWWDHVDPVATRSVGGILAAHPQPVTPQVRAWAEDDDLWLRRTAVICQLHRREHTDLDLLTFTLEANLEDSGHGRARSPEAPVGHHGWMPADTAATALHAKRAEILEQLSVLERKPGDQGSISFGKRVGEGTSMAVDRLSQVAVHDKLQTTLADVDRAMAKLDDGTYGRCDVCDKPIGDERLEALPWAVRCVEDAARR